MKVGQGVVYIVEDDASFRKSIVRLIRAFGFEVVSFESANSFLANSRFRHPACLLLDVRLPDINGLDLQQKLIEMSVSLPIIFMTGHGSIPMSVQAMKKGAVDFLPKPFEASQLRGAIEKALQRDSLSRKKELQKDKINSLIATLTPREKEVLRWIITGKLNKQIARALCTSEQTVKIHRFRVFQKTQVSSVAELVRLAEKVNILPAH
jgi:FixJ family two-component response regulator